MFADSRGPRSHLLTLALSLCFQILWIAAFATVLHQAIGELHLAGWCFAASYWGILISRLLSCVKLLGNRNLQGFVLAQVLP